MATKITRDILEAYQYCKTKAHLKLLDQNGTVSEYEALLISTRQEVRQQAIAKILARCHEGGVARDITPTTRALLDERSFALDATLEDDLFSLAFDGLKRVDGPSKLGVRVVTMIDLLPITIIDGRRGLHAAEVPVASSLDSGLSFRSLLSLGGGTGNAPLISRRPSLITEHHFVSTLNDLAPKPRTTLRATRPRDGKRTATRSRL